jgi:hypothetical protein
MVEMREPADLHADEFEELLRRAQCCIARAALATDLDSKATLLEMAAMLEGLVERAKTGERL